MPTIKLDYRPRPQFKPFHDRNQRWACAVAHRRCGKTVASIRDLERAALRCTLPNPRFAYLAPLYKQAKDVAWQYVKDGAGPLVKFGAKINESELRVDYPNNGRVRLYGADNPDALRGIYHDGVVLDEYADMKPSMWTEVIRPALSDRQGWAVFIGTPKGRDSFYDIWRAAQKDQDWYTLELKASETGILPPDELAAARHAMSESEFNREYECSFDEPGVNQFIDTKDVLLSTQRQPSVETPVVMGLDVARFGDDQTCFLIRAGDRIVEIHRRRGLDTMQTVGFAADLLGIHRPRAVFVDGVGVGGGVVDRLKQLGHKVIDVNAGGTPMRPDRFANKRAEMWGLMREWVRGRGCLPDDRELHDDICAPLYEFDASNRVKLEKKEDMKKRGMPSPDSGDALALTFAFPVSTDDARAPGPVNVVTTRPRNYGRPMVATRRM